MPLVRYIGTKDRKEDNVADTGAVWDGFGSVVEIRDAAKASKLAQHSLVWEIVPPESVDQAPRQIVGESVDDKTDEQKPTTPTLANMSLRNPDEHDDDDGSVTVAPGARPPAPGTENVPPVATAAGPRQAGGGRRSGGSRNSQAN